MSSRSEICYYALQCVDTPFVPGAHVRGKHGGMDCLGLLFYICDKLNYNLGSASTIPYDIRSNDGNVLIQQMDKYFDRVDYAYPGTILIFRSTRFTHTGIYMKNGILETTESFGKVIINKSPANRMRFLDAMYDFRGLV